MGHVKVGVGGFVGGQFGDHICRLVGQQQFGHIHRAFLQHLERRADTAGDGEFDQGLQLGRAGDADVDRQVDPCVFQAVGPFDDRLASKANWVAMAILASVRSELLFPAQRIIDAQAASVGVDVAVAFGVARDVQPFEPGLSNNRFPSAACCR